MSLQRALLALIAIVLLAGLLPAAIAVDRRLAAALEEQTRQELALAPALLADRRAAQSDALMMHAKDLASASDLTAALASGERGRAARVLEGVTALGGEAVLVGPQGVSWAGFTPPEGAVDATRRGEMPVLVVPDRAQAALVTVALAPVRQDGRWIGAAGLAVRIDRAEAETLAGLTRSEVLIVGPGGTTTAGPLSASELAPVARAVSALAPVQRVEEIRIDAHRYLAIATPLGGSASVIFVRDMARELALVPQVRRLAGVNAGLAMVIALVVGAVFAAVLARPVRALAAAAARLTAGDFDAPLVRSRITEVDRVARAFEAMRRALAARLEELQAANRELADRQQRLAALQAELIQRDRLAAAGQLVVQLAHEIRNPVANVRNCLEIVRRRVGSDPEAREFTELAIDELLRMHELAEQMLDLHRPSDATLRACDAHAVARDVAALVQAGSDGALAVRVTGSASAPAAIAPDALKQVLLNLAQNAREAMQGAGTIELAVGTGGALTTVEVSDSGPGIPAEILPRIFDPFFTTKRAVRGVGLGLFVAEGIVRAHGGQIAAENRSGGGARFRVELPAAPPAPDDAGGARPLGRAEEARA
jgi:two-component system NtrC family sensor kinase